MRLLLAMSTALVLAGCTPASPAASDTNNATSAVAGAANATATPADARDTGFTLLFNGHDLTGWVGDTRGYSVEAGAIVCGPDGRNLFTAGEYADFTLRVEFQLTPGANNGIALRAPLSGDAAFEGIEVQVLDGDHPKYDGWLKPYQHHGSVYGVVAAAREGMKPIGEWNEQEITIVGHHITVTLNGHRIVHADLRAAAAAGTLDGLAHPGLERSRGHIGFLGHGDRVAYRNIRIRLR